MSGFCCCDCIVFSRLAKRGGILSGRLNITVFSICNRTRFKRGYLQRQIGDDWFLPRLLAFLRTEMRDWCVGWLRCFHHVLLLGNNLDADFEADDGTFLRHAILQISANQEVCWVATSNVTKVTVGLRQACLTLSAASCLFCCVAWVTCDSCNWLLLVCFAAE
jgi:hypothetical protein